jgi:hypothetical protein
MWRSSSRSKKDREFVQPDGAGPGGTDYEFLTSPQSRALLREEGIIVIDYRPLQEVWIQSR